MLNRTRVRTSFLGNASAARIGAGLCITIATVTASARAEQPADAPPPAQQPSPPPPPQTPQQPSGQAVARQPVLDSTNQGAAPMDQLTLEEPAYGIPFVPEKAEKKFPFLDDARWSAQVRSMYFYRDNFDNSLSE